MRRKTWYTKRLGHKVASAAGNGDYHIIAGLENGWKVIGSANSRATRAFDSQRDAIAFGRMIARKQNVRVIIHDGNGEVRRTIPAA